MSRLRGLTALSISAFIVLACGPKAKSRRAHDENLEGTSPVDAPIIDHPNTDEGAPEQKESSAFDQSMTREVAIHYYQWDARLKDLFSPTTAVSQLCWPAALASELEYRRTRRNSPFNALPEIGYGATKEVDEIRYFAALCETDHETGTTVIQGVRCLDKHLKAAELAPSIHVGGVDAQWKSLGFFPAGVSAEDGALKLGALREELLTGRSVLLLVGYYSEDASTKVLKRERGHFVSVTGFEYMNAWAEDHIALKVMNPAVDSSSGSTNIYESVELKRLPVASGLPEDVAFEFMGRGFSDGSRRVLVESSVSF